MEPGQRRGPTETDQSESIHVKVNLVWAVRRDLGGEDRLVVVLGGDAVLGQRAGRAGRGVGVQFLRVRVHRRDHHLVLARQQPFLRRNGVLAVLDSVPAAIRSGIRVFRQEDDRTVVQQLYLVLYLPRNT